MENSTELAFVSTSYQNGLEQPTPIILLQVIKMIKLAESVKLYKGTNQLNLSNWLKLLDKLKLLKWTKCRN